MICKLTIHLKIGQQYLWMMIEPKLFVIGE